LLNITPSKTSESSKVPPGIFSTLAYLLISKFNLLIFPPLTIVLTDLIESYATNFPHLEANLVPTQDSKAYITSSSLFTLISIANSLIIFKDSSRAL
jgi:hypothetical protein